MYDSRGVQISPPRLKEVLKRKSFKAFFFVRTLTRIKRKSEKLKVKSENKDSVIQ